MRDFVLRQMLESGFITQAEHDEAVAEEIVLAPPRSQRATARRTSCTPCGARRPSCSTARDLLDTGGLRIDTTLEYDGYQVVAEKWARIGYDLDRLSDEELAAKLRRGGAGLDPQLQGRNINNDAHRDRQLPDRRRARLRRVGQLLR